MSRRLTSSLCRIDGPDGLLSEGYRRYAAWYGSSRSVEGTNCDVREPAAPEGRHTARDAESDSVLRAARNTPAMSPLRGFPHLFPPSRRLAPLAEICRPCQGWTKFVCGENPEVMA